MTESTKLDAWATLFTTFHRLNNLIEDEMKKAGHPSIEVYDVLWTLEQSPECGLRFKELGEKVYIARFNVTRLCDKLEAEGLIQKHKCDKDKRGVYAILTSEGKKLRKSMWQTYKKLIDENFSTKLTAEEHKSLIQIMMKVKLEDRIHQCTGQD